ncbi:IclR family transcriptional regulator [Georgenia phoenicis]|uniref:IclR family transcriptional regulator n=1 Tax=unclassified Georgenia TaxID=2626815 RepID=UPI0039B030E4
MATTGGSPVEAVDRALLVLDALARAGARGASLAELAAELGLNKSTVHRALAALRFRDFVTQDQATGGYLLGPAAIGLHERYFDDEQLPLLLHPALVALSVEVDELVHLGVLNGAHVLYLDKVEPQRSVRVWSAVGHRRPAATTALGRALLASRGTRREVLDGYVQAAQAVDGVPSPVTAERLWQALESARERGYAVEREENEAGISCVAVPLLSGQVPVAALSVTAPAERMTDERMGWLQDRIYRVLPPLLPAGTSLPPRA